VAWLLALLLVAGLVLSFGWLAEEMGEGDTLAFDHRVLLLFRVPGDPARLLGPAWMAEMMRDLTSLGSTVVLTLLLLLVLGYLAIARNRAAMLLMLASVAGGQLLSTLFKLGFNRPRPDLIPQTPEVFTTSFPSGHAMLSAVTYLTLAALLTRLDTRRSVKHYFMGVGILLTLLVGISRVALGVHWPTDVLAGWCLGAAWAITCATIAGRLGRRHHI
jgi:undecaprenyl-diphosphatase